MQRLISAIPFSFIYTYFHFHFPYKFSSILSLLSTLYFHFPYKSVSCYRFFYLLCKFSFKIAFSCPLLSWWGRWFNSAPRLGTTGKSADTAELILFSFFQDIDVLQKVFHLESVVTLKKKSSFLSISVEYEIIMICNKLARLCSFFSF